MPSRRFPDPQHPLSDDTDDGRIRDAFLRLYNNDDFRMFTEVINAELDSVDAKIDCTTGTELERAAAQRGILNQLVNSFYDFIEDYIRPQDVKSKETDNG